MGKLRDQLNKWLGSGEDGAAKRGQTFRWLIIVGLIGVAIVILSSFVNVKEIEPENVGREPPQETSVQSAFESSVNEATPFDTIERSFEDKMKGILEQIVGVGTVDIMVTIDSTEEIIVQRNMQDSQQNTEETDANGGERNITQYTRSGEIVTYNESGDEVPIITKKIKPQVRGVLVVAKGAENKVVKDLIVEAVEKGLNVPSYRISVVPRKQQ
ncbi:stage III sporulation protein AG [Paenibacillus sp. FSL H7-0326]|uniref:stage III sporulation protein AG n=1 Tax=Paenibacillus sp. FSL H7-0326 TaxID=1921144 RepID=UPI00096F370E|nr:stage III sporulation protein AG [Paenibacillus sp. FSL H7-0326]OMC68772.1 stage III sporulation protein AG [Paenibacillus sp. FSL H7-0326]